jgi:hypothetical protein
VFTELEDHLHAVADPEVTQGGGSNFQKLNDLFYITYSLLEAKMIFIISPMKLNKYEINKLNKQ